MLHRGEADVSATGLSPNLERTMSVDFTRILLHYEVGVTLPRTDTGEQSSSRGASKSITLFSVSINYLVFYDVFFTHLWFSIAGMAVAFSICFFIIAAQVSPCFKNDTTDSLPL